MSTEFTSKLSRRAALKKTAALAAGATGLGIIGGCNKLQAPAPSAKIKRRSGQLERVIVIGIDGMDPRLTQRMIQAGQLPNLAKLHTQGGFRELRTSIPPQSPVAWASFINGAGPGSHGIFDFIHRHPDHQCEQPFYSGAETLPGDGYWNLGEHRVQVPIWPVNHKPPATVLGRQGIPFWAYLDEQGIPSTFYDLPCDYPASPSKHTHHRCLSGMGTPDMLGTYGTYQHFSEDGPRKPHDEQGGRRSRLTFEMDTAKARLIGPENSQLRKPEPSGIELQIHRDREANAAVIEMGERKILLRAGQWSSWIKLDFHLSSPAYLPDSRVNGICRFYLQEVAPTFRLYASPINIDPSKPAVRISQPAEFATDISSDLGLFATTGFQEDHKARSNGVFNDDEFIAQAQSVLDERLRLLDYAMRHYDDGVLFFYFSSADLQAHMLWWDSTAQHPTKSADEVRSGFGHVRRLYQKLDGVIGEIVSRYDKRATVFVMSDHGFANFGRQFNLNAWLREQGYLGPRDCTSIMENIDWKKTRAYGLGINGLYLNLRGRERDGILDVSQKNDLLTELVTRLEAVRDVDGATVIRRVYRADQIYSGGATALAPDLIVGYARGYRSSWATCLGGLTDEVLLDNDSAWSADHCADAGEVPGVLFSNRPIQAASPSLVDIAPSILAEFGLPVPESMVGMPIFTT
jgi:predicted AlkP superfamily phosphohydrolase/phosphomutase